MCAEVFWNLVGDAFGVMPDPHRRAIFKRCCTLVNTKSRVILRTPSEDEDHEILVLRDASLVVCVYAIWGCLAWTERVLRVCTLHETVLFGPKGSRCRAPRFPLVRSPVSPQPALACIQGGGLFKAEAQALL